MTVRSGWEDFTVCSSYGLLTHVHNDTLAALLCQVLGLGDTGLASDPPAIPGHQSVTSINVTGGLDVTVGEETTDNCGGMNRSLAITCMSEYKNNVQFKI